MVQWEPLFLFLSPSFIRNTAVGGDRKDGEKKTPRISINEFLHANDNRYVHTTDEVRYPKWAGGHARTHK